MGRREHIGPHLMRSHADQRRDLRSALCRHLPAADPAANRGVTDAHSLGRAGDASEPSHDFVDVHGGERNPREHCGASGNVAPGFPRPPWRWQPASMGRTSQQTVADRLRATDAGTIGKRLQLLRHRSELNQADAAEAIGVSRPALSAWENDQKRPSRENLRGAAMYYRVSLDWIMEGGAEPIVAETRTEETVLKAFREAPENVRSAIEALLKPYGDTPQEPPRQT